MGRLCIMSETTADSKLSYESFLNYEEDGRLDYRVSPAERLEQTLWFRVSQRFAVKVTQACLC